MSSGRYETEDTMAERVEGSGWLRLLFFSNRVLFTGVLAAVVFLAFVVLGEFGPPRLEGVLATKSTIEMLFGSMLGAIITGVTLVVTISQIIVSQENGPLGDQHKRMSDAMNFREYLGDLLGRPVPPAPATFLRAIVESVRERAIALRESTADANDADLREDVEEFTDSIVENAEEVEAKLDDAEFGTFGVVSAALDFNYAVNIYFVEELTDRYGDGITDTQGARFDDLKTALTMFGPAREHVKTLYFEWELANLSKYVLYAAIPAIVVAGLMVSYVDGGTFVGQTAGVADVVWLVGAAFTITVLPFLLLAAYILRIVVVAKRTLAIGPLVLRELDAEPRDSSE